MAAWLEHAWEAVPAAKRQEFVAERCYLSDQQDLQGLVVLEDLRRVAVEVGGLDSPAELRQHMAGRRDLEDRPEVAVVLPGSLF